NKRIQIIKDVTPSSNFLEDGECTGTLNLYGFDLLCCCYINPLNCLYTASPYSTEYDPTTQNLEGKILRDDQFLCIKGFLNSSSPELKFRGSRNDILTDLAPQCYTLLTIIYDKDSVFNLSITFGAVLNNDMCNETDASNQKENSYQYLRSPWGFHSVYNIQEEPIEIV
uniref:Uncharacterized protein n=1 Tax=Panagrolaimus sp. ES5 TaxID=591445 RepID=A0AC34GLW3_9BILA